MPNGGEGRVVARKYEVVVNKAEVKRLVPYFWKILNGMLDKDKVKAVSVHPSTMDELITTREAKRLYEAFKPVDCQDSIIMRGRTTDGNVSGLAVVSSEADFANFDSRKSASPIEKRSLKKKRLFSFDMEDGVKGLLEDRTGTGYMVQHLFAAVKHFDKPIEIEDLPAVVEKLRVV